MSYDADEPGPDEIGATCKYCYETHSEWTLLEHTAEGEPVWLCENCDHATADSCLELHVNSDEDDEALRPLTIPLDQIIVGNRKRKDLGDLRPLADSIDDVGLLHPVVVRPDNTLVAGQRRMEACRLLGWAAVPVTVARDLEEEFAALRAETAENVCRLPLSPMEALDTARDLEDRAKAEAKARQEATQAKPGERIGAGNFPAPMEQGQTRDVVGAAVGWSGRTYEKAKAVAVAADVEPEAFGHLPAVMEDTGKVDKAYSELRRTQAARAVEAEAAANPDKPTVTLADWRDWLPEQDDCDLLLTDPPYSTDVPDIAAFAHDWLPQALAKVKPTGRAYVFIGAYPEELLAYLSADRAGMDLVQVLSWHYTNTLSAPPADRYKLNWQAVLYFVGPDAPALNCPLTAEHVAGRVVNAPGGFGNETARYHAWEKPLELAEAYVRHSTPQGGVVLDCFAGTGTHLLAAARVGRIAAGCDNNPEMLAIAGRRGCEVIE